MEKDILSRVIEVEREIQEKLKEEKKKSLKWLEKVKKEAEKEIAGEEDRLYALYTKTFDDTMAEAEKEAAEIARISALEAERLTRISDEALTGIVLKYIPGILPAESSARSTKAPKPS